MFENGCIGIEFLIFLILADKHVRILDIYNAG